MAVFFDCVEMIESLDKARKEAIKEKEAAQKALEEMFASYIFCCFSGIKPLMDIYARQIKEHNEGIRVFMDFQVETFEKSSNLLKGLIVRKATDKELEEGIAKVEENLRELHMRAKKFF